MTPITRTYPIVNKAQCALCGSVIESKNNHDFVVCHCGEIFIDGGVGPSSSPRAGANDLNNIIDFSEYITEEYTKQC